MFLWLAGKLGLSVLWSKIVFFGVAGLVIFCALNFTWYRNRLINQGMSEGRAAATAEIQKAKEIEWQAREKKIATEAADIAQAKAAVDGERLGLERSRAAIQGTLTRSLQQIATSYEVSNAHVLAVPDADLVRAVRSLSAELGTGSAVAK